jgi:hypothetical protein
MDGKQLSGQAWLLRTLCVTTIEVAAAVVAWEWFAVSWAWGGAGILFVLTIQTVGLLEILVFLRRLASRQAGVELAFSLAGSGEFYRQFERIGRAVVRLDDNRVPLLREVARARLGNIAADVERLAAGQIEFTNTEAWRALYEQLLSSLDVKIYYSVALVKSDSYWNNPPGRQSIDFNFELVQRGYRIERIFIISDELWSLQDALPGPNICDWIRQQHDGGIYVSLIRQGDFGSDADLATDFGIYGRQAVGAQQLDDLSRTVRFSLDFRPESLESQLQRWERLKLYARGYHQLLDTAG